MCTINPLRNLHKKFKMATSVDIVKIELVVIVYFAYKGKIYKPPPPIIDPAMLLSLYVDSRDL